MTRLLIHESPLQVLPTLACKIGLNEAMLLQQIHYWLDPKMNKHHHEGKHWIYNTFKEWHEQFPFFSERTLERTVANLENQNLLYVGYFNKNSWDRTKWYSINYDVLKTLERSENPHSETFRQNGGIESAKLSSSYIDTETTTEITQKNEMHSASLNQKSVSQSPLSSNAFAIWKDKIGCKTTLNSERAKKLETLIFNELNEDFEAWDSLVDSITQTPFLMGDNSQRWRITLAWILKTENFRKVMEGHYEPLNVKPQPQDSESTCEDRIKERTKAIFEATSDQRLQNIMKDICHQLGDATFVTWFENSEWSIEKNHLKIICLSVFAKCHIQNNFSEILIQASQSVNLSGLKIQVTHELFKKRDV